MPNKENYHENSKELLADSYSIQNCKPWQIYEIGIEKADRGFSIRVSSYYEAMNDCLHKIYTDEQVREIYSRFRYVNNIADLKEEIDWSNSDNLEETYQILDEQIEKLYGKKDNIPEIPYWASKTYTTNLDYTKRIQDMNLNEKIGIFLYMS